MPSEPIPKFDGKASTFATFIMEFVGYAILHIDGVKYLHALEQNHDPDSWYTMKTHVGTGTNYHYEDTDESNVKNMFNLSGANTQHMNKRLAFSRDVVQRIECRPQSTPGKDNCADALTKALPTPEFERHADVLLGLAHARSLVQ